MSSNKKRNIIIISSVGVVLVIGIIVYSVLAGDLNSPAAPAPTMYTLEQIYKCLNEGESYCNGVTEGAHNLEPQSSHASTMYDLNQLWRAIPWHNPGTATSGDVCGTSTFYTNSATKLTGSRTNCGNWTPQGTATSGVVRCGKTFYASTSTKETGTWCPSGQTCSSTIGVCQ